MPRTLPRQNRAPRGPYAPQRCTYHTREERRRFRERERRFQAWSAEQAPHVYRKRLLHGIRWISEYAAGRGGLILFGHEFGPHVVFVELPFCEAFEEYLERFTEPLTAEELADYADPENEDGGGYSAEVLWINGKAYVEPENLWAREFRNKGELKAYLRSLR